MTDKRRSSSIFKMLPALFIALFFGLSLVAAMLYPGGSQKDLTTSGFGWHENYWCELLNPEAMNGKPNPGMPFGVIGMFCLGSAMSISFYLLPVYCPTTAGQQAIVRISSMLASFFACMLFTGYHHPMLLGFSIFTFVTILTALIILAEGKQFRSFFSGLVVFLMVQINNVIYYLNWHKEILPSFQKATIILVVLWVLSLSLKFRDPTCPD